MGFGAGCNPGWIINQKVLLCDESTLPYSKSEEVCFCEQSGWEMEQVAAL